MRIVKNILILFLLIPFFSCEKECEKSDSVLTDTIDLTHLYPIGTYENTAVLNNDKITFNSDSTAVLKYRNNNVDYEFTYTVQTEKTYVSEQRKFKE